MTTSAPRAASAGVAATRGPESPVAPVARTNSAARSAVRFQTVSGMPAAAMCVAIGQPIAPSPRKAVFMPMKLPCPYLSRMITRARVEGMSCQHCVRAVFTALAAVEGITRADVRIGQIEVEHDGAVTVEQLRRAVEVAGYVVSAGETNRRALPLV